MAQIFGFTIDRSKKTNDKEETFAQKEFDDGALVVADTGYAYSTQINLDSTATTDAEMINKYREMAMYPEVEMAIDDIVNETITNDPDEPQVKIILDELEVSDKVKKVIEEEFNGVLELLEFKQKSYETFKRWYVDGRLYFHMVVDSSNLSQGIQELRYIDPRKIKKVRTEKKKQSKRMPDLEYNDVEKEYYIYSEGGFSVSKSNITPSQNVKGLKISKDSIAYLTSGLMDPESTVVLSYLHKAIKPLNMLKSMEDSLVIYRLSRAPERRVFYIDTGGLPPAKAEQHIKNMMIKFKNKVQYDAKSGEVRDDRKFLTMTDDFWMARRGNGNTTEIKTLEGGQNLGEITDVNYFQKKLYRSLNVPLSRLDPDMDTFTLGRATQISRDELKFQKFINRLRLRFQTLFATILGKQLVLKGIVNEDEWKDFLQKIDFRFSEDNYFAELKETEILNERLNALDALMPIIGRFVSNEWARKNVLRQTDEDIEKEDELIAAEMLNPQYKPELLEPPMDPDEMQQPNPSKPQPAKKPNK
jgi:hypothetical protein